MLPSDGSALSRREYLRAGSAVVAGSAAATAGCLEGLPPLGQRVRYGRIDAPPPLDSEPTYRQWIPAPSTVPDGIEDIDLELYSVPGTLGSETLGTSFQFGNSIVRSQSDYFGMAFGDYDRVIWLNGVVVVETSVDRQLVEQTLLDTGYEAVGSYRTYDLFDRSDNPRTVAVGDEAIVYSPAAQRRQRVETVVDAGDGNVARRHEVDDPFETFTGRVGSYPFGWFGVGLTDVRSDAELASLSYTFDESAAYFVYHQQYQSGETPTERDIRSNIEESNRAIQSTGVDIDIEESFVTVQMRLDASVFRDRTRDARIPLVTFGVDYDRTTGTLYIRNEGGGELTVDNLSLEPETQLGGRVEWPGSTLSPGESVSIDVSGLDEDVDSIRLVYEFPDSHDTAVIFSYSFDDPAENE